MARRPPLFTDPDEVVFELCAVASLSGVELCADPPPTTLLGAAIAAMCWQATTGADRLHAAGLDDDAARVLAACVRAAGNGTVPEPRVATVGLDPDDHHLELMAAANWVSASGFDAAGMSKVLRVAHACLTQASSTSRFAALGEALLDLVSDLETVDPSPGDAPTR